MHSPIQSWKNTFIKLGFVQKKRSMSGRRNHLVRRLRIESLEDRQMLAITVDTLLDEEDGDIDGDDVSLRDAVILAPAGETINFAPSLNGATITLLHNLSHIEFGKNLTIDASMLANGITIDANDTTPNVQGDGIRIFNIRALTGPSFPPLVTLVGLTLTGGDVPDDGGAIRSEGELILRDCVVESNEAASGGGIFIVNNGAASSRIENSTISGNTARQQWGSHPDARSGAWQPRN